MSAHTRAKLAEAQAKLELAKRGLSAREDVERVLTKYVMSRAEVERRWGEIFGWVLGESHHSS
jgi:hypothetical protein